MTLHRKLLTATVAGLMVSTVSAASAQTDVRYAIWAKEGEAQHLGAQEFQRVLETESDGRFKVTIFPGNQLGTPREVLAQMALGTTQMLASGDPGIKEIEYLALPYLMKGLENYAAVLATDFGEAWNDKLVKERMVRTLGFMPRSPRQISANKVVNSMADLKGLKLRAPERDYYVKSLTALGANPTPMAFKEVYTSLQTGVVDGQENPIETIYAAKFYEVQKSIAMVDYIFKPAYVTISETFWQGLSEADRALFVKANDASNTVIGKLLPQQEKDFIARMTEAGLTITYPDKAEFVAATQSVRGMTAWGEETYKRIVDLGQKDF